MSEKKLFLSVSLIIIFLFICFWSFAYFLTEAKPIQVPIFSEINFKTSFLLFPLIFLNYFFLFKFIIRKKVNFGLIFFLAFSLIIFTNSLKKNIPFYFSLESSNDSYQDALVIKNLYKFLAVYHENIYYYGLHTRTHPPGPVIFHFLLQKIPFTQVLFNSLVMVSLSLGSLLVVYRLALLLKNPQPKYLLLLLLSSPGFLLFSATSMDAVSAFLISLSCYFILRFNLERRFSAKLLITAGLVIFSALFFTYASVIIPIFAFCLMIFSKFKNKSFIFKQFILAILVCFIYFVLYQLSRFNPLKSFFASRDFNTMLMPDIFMTTKRYFYSVSANFIEYLVFLGLPLFTLLIITFANLFSAKNSRLSLTYYLSFLLPMILLNLLGIYKTGVYSGETGRIWLFLTPLIIAGLKIKNTKLLIFAGFLSFLQTLIIQSTLNIFW